MVETKDPGIWMDHSTAHLMEFTVYPIEIKTLHSTFTDEDKEHTFEKSEHLF